MQGELPRELRGTGDPRRLQFTGFQGDFFEPRVHFAVMNVRRALGERSAPQLNGFVRSNRFSPFNGNITEANARGDTTILSAGGTAQLVYAEASGLSWTGGIEYVRNHTDILIFDEPNPAFPGSES